MPRFYDFSKHIGVVHRSNEGIDFQVIGISDNKTSRGNAMFIVKSLKTGYETEVEYGNFKNGRVKDYGIPTVKGVGYSYKGCDSTSVMYKRWASMLERCYDPKFSKYQWYGGKGVKVCDRWLHFKNFEEDIKKLKNYEKFLKTPRLYELDKDIIGDGMLYSPETCIFAGRQEQINAQKSVKPIIAIDKEGNQQSFISVRACCRELGVPNANVYAVLRGERKQAMGYTFERP